MLQTHKQSKKETENQPNNERTEESDVFEKSQKISDDWFARTTKKDFKNSDENKK